MNRALLTTIVATAAILTAVLVIGSGAANLRPVATTGEFSVSTVIVFGIGLLLGIIWVRAFGEWLGWSVAGAAPWRKLADWTLLCGGITASIYLGVAASTSGASTPLKAALVIALASAALVSGHRCLEALGRGEAIGIESHWGGLGGGAGGWRLLPATAMFFLSLSFISAAIIVALAEPAAVHASPEKPRPEPGATNAPADNASTAAGNSAGQGT